MKPTDHGKGINCELFSKPSGMVVVDYYTAYGNDLDRFIDFFKPLYFSFLTDIMADEVYLWVDEMTVNEKTLVVITNYGEEWKHHAFLHFAEEYYELKIEIEKYIVRKKTLVLNPVKA